MPMNPTMKTEDDGMLQVPRKDSKDKGGINTNLPEYDTEKGYEEQGTPSSTPNARLEWFRTYKLRIIISFIIILVVVTIIVVAITTGKHKERDHRPGNSMDEN